MNPLGNNIVAVNEVSETHKSGIILTTVNEQAPYLTVKYVGPDVSTIKPEDKVVVRLNYSTRVKLDKTEYVIFSEDEVLAKIK